MADRDGGGSRWSGAREREERQRQRALERERAKQARLARESGAAPPQDESSLSSRRLTDEERRTIRQYRFPAEETAKAPREAPGAYPSPKETPAESNVTDGSESDAGSTGSVGTRWRDSLPESGGGSGSGNGGLPNLPGDNDGGGGFERPSNTRLVIFGSALLLLMVALAFMPFGPFGGNDGNDDEPLPTPSQTLPSIFATEGTDAPDEDGDGQPAPVAESGQAVVCIDPGHGGWDTGWNRTDQEGLDVGPYPPPIVTEAELNLGMSYMLKAELEEMGYFVVLTRPSGAAVNMFDEDVNGDGETRLNAENPEQAGDRDELQARILACNEAEADILISMHINGFDDPSARGFEVLYTAEREFGEQNAQLATLIYRQMTEASQGTDMQDTGRGADPDTTADVVRHEFGTADHYLMTGPAVESISITPSEMPGVIVEAGFLSNDLDAAWMVQPDNQRLFARAYAQGIQDYFEQYPPAS